MEEFEIEIAIYGVLMLMLSPRILGESFFNSKDIVFLSFTIFAIYTLMNFLDKPSLVWSIVHALTSAMLIDIRILGVLIPILTILLVTLLLVFDKSNDRLPTKGLIFILFLPLFVILFWPILWEGPINHFISAFVEMKKYEWDFGVLFLGKTVIASQLPWYYILVWIVVSTPIIYILLFFLGFASFIKSFCIKPRIEIKKSKLVIISSVMFFGPIIMILIFKSIVYDGWRHMYFVYPSMIIIATYGLDKLYQYIKNYSKTVTLFRTSLYVYFLSLVIWIVNNHPHENVYFNRTFTIVMNPFGNMELDYWGLSYKQAYEYLLANENPRSTKMRIKFLNAPGELNYLGLTENGKEHFEIYDVNKNNWDYYFTNYRGEGLKSNMELVHHIKVGNYPIMGIYKRKEVK